MNNVTYAGLNESEEIYSGESQESVESQESGESMPPMLSKFDFVKDKLDSTVEWFGKMYSKHPNENNMSGLHHFIFSLKLSGMTLLSGMLLLAHAVAPWWFTTTGGDLLLYTSETLKKSRHTSETQKEDMQPIDISELQNPSDGLKYTTKILE